ncbi:N5-glutamine S-adenosyl-L-methionine-dependent methyltransferase [Streptococcus cristatus]|uniref:Release factor glutamine methyltransferase n=2 Tax=Streptococcus cristatus TaxID=45634 RepID=A0A512AA48_STRCR|nr:peptide chain release factor N(5)-glutamine methyltransferase [Streptococcus cristatus]AGK70762.1 N5-glutamine S-adenosyl-L-methionine-dependent methyltransferase [Streptococcus cristatus AS 1.3089]GEN96571.1 release factor glutamine methyltransferase [Streptococcus cristatus]SQI46675.1 N5-glutamine S-adenosyl-L-methionine-dependent methyltransferase [Streptococcus cristatus]
MTLAQYLAELEQELVAAGEEAESLSFVYRALNDLSFTDFVLKLQAEVSQEDRDHLKAIQEQLLAHKPAQYIIGNSDFHGLTLKVDERVLIPRPETEELVELILSENPEKPLSVLDIGTGSGAIALALANSRPDWQITASDLSQDALALAAENAQSCGLNLTFVQSDCLKAINGTFDIIVSNPPYISEADKDEVGLNVLVSEPHMALFAEEDGYAVYRKIAEQAEEHLTEKGKIYLEIGYKQGVGVKELFKKYFPQKRIRVLQDQFGKDRMVAMDNG